MGSTDIMPQSVVTADAGPLFNVVVIVVGGGGGVAAKVCVVHAVLLLFIGVTSLGWHVAQ